MIPVARTEVWPARLAGLLLLLVVVPVTGLVESLAAAQADWSLVRPMPVVTLEIRKVVGLALLVPAGTLFLLYLFRPRPYVLAGVVSWLAGSVMLLVLSIDLAAPGTVDAPGSLESGRLAVAVWAVAALIFGASLRSAAMWFRAPSGISAAVRWPALIGVVWTGFAVAFLGPRAVIAPAFIIMSLWLTKGAIAYFQAARQYRFVGATMAGLGLAGLVAVNTIAVLVAMANGEVSHASATVTYFNIVPTSLLILGMHLLIFEDVIEELRTAGAALSESRDEMRAMAVTDPLTRCYNRRFLEEIATHELEQHRRYGLPLSLLYIDIDHFKAINDTRGHHTGDRVLQTMGTILRAHTRQADYVLRWGGDEFLVLLSADEARAAEKAQEIRQAFLESPIVRDLPDGVDLSIGCVGVPPETEQFAPLIDQADREMYRRKRALAG